MSSYDNDIEYLMTPYLQLEAEGPAFNPYAEEDGDFGAYADSILVRLGLCPEYSYLNGRNRIRYRIRKKTASQARQLCFVIAAASLIGILGRFVLSDAMRTAILTALIEPLYNTFFNILGCIAGPMIFLSVSWGIYGIGDAATFGRIGKRMMLTYTGIALLASACGAMLFPLLGPGISSGTGSGGQLSSIAELLLGIFPSTIVEPFATGNTLQIIFLAIVIGIALLYLGRQTSSVARAIEQVNRFHRQPAGFSAADLFRRKYLCRRQRGAEKHRQSCPHHKEAGDHMPEHRACHV